MKIAKELKQKDNMFPPVDLWSEYYGVEDLSKIYEENYDIVEF